ncbi:TMAO reductase system periplasmic protein TorT [Vibrio sonorensis]|uniref:TMAO reductase system periplasmic protein TorT n=1 Tax=Vibrio sonorensis TaxID=1004316 RepID=UPI0008D92996|nr:TMAO reductase system periplasmic protein TorT [Vibrio sonorensis]
MKLLRACQLLITTFATLCSTTAFANTKYKLCAVYPHLKDSYWISVNYGMVKAAIKEDITLRVFESGGYPNLKKQQAQIKYCAKWGADAILLGTVDPNAYHNGFNDLVGPIPVFAIVNQLNLDLGYNLHGRVGADWYDMGFLVGQKLSELHPKGSKQAKIALLPGPKSSGGTKPVLEGLNDALTNSSAKVTSIHWADNDKELQRNLVQEIIDSEEVDYIVGSAVAIEVAISELRAANRLEEIGLLSTYLSHGVYRGLIRGKVLFSPTDLMVKQGEASILQAVSHLSGKTQDYSISPTIIGLEPDSLDSQVIQQSLSPSEFRPTFILNSEQN